MRDAVNIDGEGERVDLLAQRRRDLSVSVQWFERRRRPSCIGLFTFTVFSNSNKTPFCSTSRVSQRRQRAGYFSLHFSAKDNDDDNDEDEPSLEERCGLTAFFPVTSARRTPALSARMEIRSALVPPLFLPDANPGIEKEPRTFICNVSRFRLKSPFQSTSCPAVVSYICQKALPKLFQAARLVASFGSRTI